MLRCICAYFLCICTLNCAVLQYTCMRNSAFSLANCQTLQCLRSARPRAVWLLLTECHDPEISAFVLTGGFEISGLKVLWDYISEGFCHDGSWQVLLLSGWRNSAERLSFIVWTVSYEQKKYNNDACKIQCWSTLYFCRIHSLFFNLCFLIKSSSLLSLYV